MNGVTDPQSFMSLYLHSDIILIWVLATGSHLWPIIVPHNYTNTICHPVQVSPKG